MVPDRLGFDLILLHTVGYRLIDLRTTVTRWLVGLIHDFDSHVPLPGCGGFLTDVQPVATDTGRLFCSHHYWLVTFCRLRLLVDLRCCYGCRHPTLDCVPRCSHTLPDTAVADLLFGRLPVTHVYPGFRYVTVTPRLPHCYVCYRRPGPVTVGR